MTSTTPEPGHGCEAIAGPDPTPSSADTVSEDTAEPMSDLAATAGPETPRAEEEPVARLGDAAAHTPPTASSSSPPPLVQQPHKTVSADSDTYFAPRPIRLGSAQLSIPEDQELSVSPASRHLAPSPASFKSAHDGVALTPEHVTASTELPERPAARHAHSNTSNLSAASTVRATDLNAFLPLSPTRSLDSSSYPAQALSELHRHGYTVQPSPHFLRSRSSHLAGPSQGSNLPPIGDDIKAATAPPSRAPSAASNAGVSGLFTPRVLTSRPTFHHADTDDGTYASPFLHHTQRVVPKETHLAEIDFDPISGRKVINQYEVIDELGRGVHGKVKLGRNLFDGSFVAIKIVERYSKRKRLGKNNSHEAKIKKEIAILKKARHPNIVGLLEVIDDPASKKVYIILEHVELGEVQWRIEGSAEICTIEWRRVQREAEGVFEDEVAEQEDGQILKEGRTHFEKHDRRKWRRIRQQRSANGEATFSLEFGDDEDDENSTGKISRIPSATTSLSHGLARVPDYPPPDQTVFHYGDTAMPTSEPSGSGRDLHAMQDKLEAEGSGFGSFEQAMLRGRTPSVAGSVSSAGYERDIMERLPENFRYVPTMTIEAARKAFRDTVLGLEYLHYQGVVHRDIKPANLLQAADSAIKISDFGVSYLGKEKTEPHPGGEEASEVEDQDYDEAIELAKTVGTPAFYAPELCQTDFDPDVETPPVTLAIDIWALGVTLYCLIYGRVPFYDENTFHLMRIIAKDEVYIPSHRLKAVDTSAKSRPPSRNRAWASSTHNSKRLPHDLEYEAVDDDLKDILRRMLTKDPRQRISLYEVKKHPWLIADISATERWIYDSEPNAVHQGNRVEISNEDVENAVVSINLVDKVTSVFRLAGQAIGLSSRKRAESEVTDKSDRNLPNSAALSASGSSSSMVSQDARKQGERPGRSKSVKPEESILLALKASKQGERQVSRSVNASPEPRELEFLSGPDSAPGSPMSTISQAGHWRASSGSIRPTGPDRFSTGSGSTRTIRPGDVGLKTGASTLPAMPSTPLEMHAPSTLSGIFGGAKQLILDTVQKARERSRGHSSRASSPHDSSKTASVDPHGTASLGVSDEVARGQINSPDMHWLDCALDSSSVNSPLSSRAASYSSNLHLTSIARSEGGISRQSSASSINSPRRGRAVTNASSTRPVMSYLPLLGDAYDTLRGAASSPSQRRDRMDAEFLRAHEEHLRRRIAESQSRPGSAVAHQELPSDPSLEECPPSPDDLTAWQKEMERGQHDGESLFYPADQPQYATHSQLANSSSEDHFTGMSQCTSNPSIPSVASANSSLAAEDHVQFLDAVMEGHDGHKQTMRQFSFTGPFGSQSLLDDAAYDGDHAVESGDDDSDSDDGVLMISSKSRKKALLRSESIAVNEPRRVITEILSPAKTGRSGSSNTMKKIRSHETEDEEPPPRPVSSAN